MVHPNLQVRVQAIRGLPLFCKDTPEHLSKIIDILAQLLTAGNLVFHAVLSLTITVLCTHLILVFLALVEENVERDAVHKALLSLLRQDVKGNCFGPSS